MSEKKTRLEQYRDKIVSMIQSGDYDFLLANIIIGNMKCDSCPLSKDCRSDHRFLEGYICDTKLMKWLHEEGEI